MKRLAIFMLAVCLTGCSASYKQMQRKALDSIIKLNKQGAITDSLYCKGYNPFK